MSDFESSVEAVSSFPAPVREGLPPSYRMRAEGHYVDLLASRSSGPREKTLSVHVLQSDAPAPVAPQLVESIRTFGVLQPLIVQEQDDEFHVIAGHKRLSAAREAGLREVPCIVHDVANGKAACLREASHVSGTIAPPAPPEPKLPVASLDRSIHAGSELAQSLATIVSCADLLSASPSDLTRGVVGNLIRAESARAAALLTATRILRGELTALRKPIDAVAVLAKVAHSFLAERTVRRCTVDVQSTLPAHTCVLGDEPVLIGALTAAVMATLPLFEGAVDVSIALTATAESGQPTLLAVTQRDASAPAAWSSRAFDREWHERPGGVVALVSMLAVRQAAETLGATLTVAGDSGGTSIALGFPTTW